MVSIVLLGAFLEGSWNLERLIIDRRSGQVATMAGMAGWTRTTDTELLYTEAGTLRVGAHSGAAKRSSRFVFRSATSADVLFEDRSFFHRLDLTTGRAEFEHLCGADTYVGTFEVRSDAELHQQWTVGGPAKDYVSTTVLQKRRSI